MVAAMVGIAAPELSAVEYVWTGNGADNNFSTPENWQDDAAPVAADAAVLTFNSPGTTTVVYDGDKNGGNMRFAKLKVMQGDVAIVHAATGKSFYLGKANSSEVYVAEGSSLSITNSFLPYYPDLVLRKTGGGTLSQITSRNGENMDGQSNIKTFYVEGGEFRKLGGGYFGCRALEIAPGAKVLFSSDVTCRTTPPPTSLPAGAVLEFVGGGLNIPITGAGDIFYTGSGCTFYTNNASASGRVLVGETGNLTISPNVDLRRSACSVAEFRGLGGTMNFSSKYTNEIPVRGTFAVLQYNSNSAKVIAGLDGVCVTGNYFKLNGSAQYEFKGREAIISKVDNITGTANPAKIVGGKFYGPLVTDAKDTVTTLKKEGFVDFGGYNGVSGVDCMGGELWLGSCVGVRDVFMHGGKLHAKTYLNPQNNVSKFGQPHIVFDGGEVVLEARGTAGYEFCTETSVYTNEVGAGGGVISICRRADSSNRYCYFYNPFATREGIEEDGGLEFRGNGIWYFSKPLRITGPVRVNDGLAYVHNAQTANGALPFGSGDFILDNAALSLHEQHSSSDTVRLADGEGSAFGYGGAALVVFRTADTRVAQSVSVGALRRERAGSVLFLRELEAELANFGGEGGSSFKVDGMATTNWYRGPVLAVGSTGWQEYNFVKYDADGGFAPIPHSECLMSTLAGSDENKILWGGATLSSGTARLGGAIVNKWSWLSVSSGATLQMGNGVDPAIIVGIAGGFISGGGTIDFGTSEGIIVSAYNHNDDVSPQSVGCVLAGSSSVTFTACPCYANNSKVAITKANTYSGGTYVTAGWAIPRHAQAFSSGTVNVVGGERHGGTVNFDTALTFNNRFVLSGWGYQQGNKSPGAFRFAAAANVAGPVELVGQVRVVPTAGVEGTISGAISGGELVVNGNSAGNDTCVLKLTGANVYTGGTWVVKSTLALDGACSVGTGRVILDGATLRFDSDNDVTFTNRVEGLGTIRLAGRGAVSFDELETQDKEGFTLDAAAKVVKIGSLDGIKEIVSSRAGDVSLVVMDGNVDFAGAKAANVTLYSPETFTPPGLVISIR